MDERDHKHWKYGMGFCGNCAKSAKIARIVDWFPTHGNVIPRVNLCKPCLLKILEGWIDEAGELMDMKYCPNGEHHLWGTIDYIYICAKCGLNMEWEGECEQDE